MIVRAKRVLTPAGLRDDGWVEVAEGLVAAWGVGEPPAPADEMFDLISPGFVDVHSHGGGGANFTDGADAARVVLDAHLAHGTTTMIASLITAPLDALVAQIEALTPLVESGDLAGIHLEGPWLAPSYKGAHDAAMMRDPSLPEIHQVVTSGPVAMVTIAPERPGAIEVIRWLASRQVVVAVGHTGADDACTRAAIAAGARGATHLFNAMPELLHRAPGPVLPLWESPDVWVELVCDGVHVAGDLVAAVMKSKPQRCVLVTDAMAAAGTQDGDYMLGGLAVEVRGGVARLAGTNTIAGSTLTLDQAVRVATRAGAPLELALQAASSHPADYLGITGVGRLEAGDVADIVALDDALQVVKVMRRGHWVR
ncbi:MAG: N-acetylglucosamine-6-phosphate deacetylase [Propionibacteriaceae bacterium]|nr:N-acetylglucosamine-6-phosphate deacetylase [Propionibacteriaceae bacterium]